MHVIHKSSFASRRRKQALTAGRSFGLEQVWLRHGAGSSKVQRRLKQFGLEPEIAGLRRKLTKDGAQDPARAKGFAAVSCVGAKEGLWEQSGEATFARVGRGREGNYVCVGIATK